jgi:hypothetical protein
VFAALIVSTQQRLPLQDELRLANRSTALEKKSDSCSARKRNTHLGVSATTFEIYAGFAREISGICHVNK